MRILPAWAVLTACTASCRAPDAAAGFAAALRDAPAGAVVAVEWRDRRIVRYLAPLAETDIPAAARRTADEYVQPGGEVGFRGHEWNERGGGYRFVKVYGPHHARRSVLVNATGDVLERSHEIALDECSAAVLAAARELGVVERVEVLQGARGVADRYRVALRREDGVRMFAECSAQGEVLATGRTLDARVTAAATR